MRIFKGCDVTVSVDGQVVTGVIELELDFSNSAETTYTLPKLREQCGYWEFLWDPTGKAKSNAKRLARLAHLEKKRRRRRSGK